MNRVILSGGLGNQLFQVAAGMYFFGHEQTTLVESLGKPHGGKRNLSEMKLLNLPKTISLETRRWPIWTPLITKINNFQVSLFLTDSARTRLLGKLLLPISNFLITFYFNDKSKVKYCRQISNVGEIKKDTQNVISGYFQNHDYVSNPEVKFRICELLAIEKSQELTQLIEEAKQMSPLVIQVRLGDYMREDDFGIPGTDYYKRAIEFILERQKHQNIWIYSNDIQMAKKILPREYNDRYKFIENLLDSPVETLEAMRHGVSYILSNSTYGWWGAFLSHQESPLVITPSPWFRSGNSPKGLVPDSWTKIPVGEYFC
jgi:hypothetical protein